MTTINLNVVKYPKSETLLVQAPGISVFTFKYPSGVKALRIRNQVGEVIFLPFQGQQIWDCHFYGRRLTMRSMFDEPMPTTEYLKNYGGFMLHCGATAMGNPAADDTHPLHGELPNASYQSAQLSIGQDDTGSFIILSGQYWHTVAFAHNYVAEPSLRIHANHARMALDFKVHNLKRDTMELMYLAHINFKPVDGSTLVDTVPNQPQFFNIRDKVPEFFTPTAEHTALIMALKTNPALHRELTPGTAIDPELVMGLRFKVDGKGFAHAMQVMPDKSADFVSFRTDQLRRGVRWITRTANQDALGLFLPGTAEADGYHAEKAKGNIVHVPAGQIFICTIEFGALDPAEAEHLRSICQSVMKD